MSENMFIPKIPQLCEQLIAETESEKEIALGQIEKYIDSISRK
jgi:hypothetical protein